MLARIRKSMEEKDQGFTLIELLVVIIIIGILAAIAIPVFLNQRKKAVDSAVKSDLKNAATNIESYYTNNQQYPSSATWSTQTSLGSNDSITVSTGDVLKYTLNTDGSYTITGYNLNGTANGTGSTGCFVYNSAAGGLQSAPGAC